MEAQYSVGMMNVNNGSSNKPPNTGHAIARATSASRPVAINTGRRAIRECFEAPVEQWRRACRGFRRLAKSVAIKSVGSNTASDDCSPRVCQGFARDGSVRGNWQDRRARPGSTHLVKKSNPADVLPHREGCYVLRSNLTDPSAQELWRAYIQLTEAEAADRGGGRVPDPVGRAATAEVGLAGSGVQTVQASRF